MTMQDPEYAAQIELNNKANEALAALRQAAPTTPRRFVAPESPRYFLSPTHPNGRFLVTAGTPRMSAPNPASLGMLPMMERVGDVWAIFTAGTCASQEQAVVSWLEAHGGDPEDHGEYHKEKGEDPRTCSVPVGLCKEQGPGVDTWAELKAGQVDTARRDHVIDPSLDIDAFMRRDHLPRPVGPNTEGARMAQAADNTAAAERERENGLRV